MRKRKMKIKNDRERFTLTILRDFRAGYLFQPKHVKALDTCLASSESEECLILNDML